MGQESLGKKLEGTEETEEGGVQWRAVTGWRGGNGDGRPQRSSVVLLRGGEVDYVVGAVVYLLAHHYSSLILGGSTIGYS